MSVTLHIDGNRQYADVEPPEDIATVGGWADQVALEEIGSSDVTDRQFSFKANGDVLARDAKVGKVKDGAFLELIEVTEATDTVATADDSGSTTDPDAVPDGNIGDVIAWVRGGPVDQEPVDGWDERAQRALDTEVEKGNEARKTLVDLLEQALTSPTS
jgi:hypothetical protein